MFSLFAFGAVVLIATRLPTSPGLAGFVENSVGPIVPARVYVGYLDSPNPDTVMSGLYWLKTHRNPSGANRAVELLKTRDDYIWLNAATYLGTCGRAEAIPYLIKALRHSAWRTDEETLRLLTTLTGQKIGNDFELWQAWWLENHAEFQMDWESQLGWSPRLKRKDPAENTRH